MTRLRALGLAGAIAIALVGLAGCASNRGPSGGPRGHGPGGGPMAMPAGPSVDEILGELELDDDEKTAQVRGVLEASEGERSEILASHAGGRGPGAFDEVREGLDGLRARTETMLEPLLTDEQMARYRQIIDRAEEERERMTEEMKGRGPRGRGRGMGRPPGP